MYRLTRCWTGLLACVQSFCMSAASRSTWNIQMSVCIGCARRSSTSCRRQDGWRTTVSYCYSRHSCQLRQSDRSFIDADNVSLPFLRSFPHHLLRGTAHHGRLSVLTKSWLFTGICDRLGCEAFPTHLLSGETVCCVRLPNMTSGPIVVNFRQGAPLITVGAPDRDNDEAGLCTGVEVAQSFVPLHPREFLKEARMDLIGGIARWILDHANVPLPAAGNDVQAGEALLRTMHAMGCFLAATGNSVTDERGGRPLLFMAAMAETLPLDGEAVIFNALFPTDAEVPVEFSVWAAELNNVLRRVEDTNTAVMWRKAWHLKGASRHFVGEIVQDSVTNEYGCITGWKVSHFLRYALCRYTNLIRAAPART